MSKKKKILLLSDDLRMHSGVAIMSRELVFNSLDKYDWCQLGGAIKHPEHGKIVDMSDAVHKETGVKNAYLKIYPTHDYGRPDQVREIIDLEKPDAILHFTDPRQWIWLYNMEHEIRQHIPILYYNIWDDLPDPDYNRDYYRSSDLLMAISKQTYGINKRILKDYDYGDNQITYVPHGVTSKYFKLEEKGDTLFKEFETKFELDKHKFKILYVNRNIRRKQPSDLIFAYKHFMDKLTPEQQKECCLVFHTAPIDENGTDLRAVHRKVCPEYSINFTYDKMSGQNSFNDEQMNFLYNSVDVVVNIASNEGFGLATCEALSTGTPIVVNVTGGLQDQCGFKKEDGSYLTAEDYVELGSNHRGKYKEHGEWVKPVFPSNISCQGSPLTPYIFDDRCSWEDVGDAVLHWYNMGPEERERCGDLGIEFVNTDGIDMTSKKMGQNMINSIEGIFSTWKPKEKYTMELV